MIYVLEFTVTGIYETPSHIGLLEGLKYSCGMYGKTHVYYPKNKGNVRTSGIGQKFKVTFADEKITEEYV